MGKLMEITMKYSYNDVMIKPSFLSTIEHRAECNVFDENGNLPLFTAPMDSVASTNNFDLFASHGIIPILPRTESIDIRIEYALSGKWAAFSLQEFEQYFCNLDEKYLSCNINALIDIANGHVTRLYNLVRNAKSIYGNSITIMVGNIANPETYRECVESHVDYVRCGIGGGQCCITSSNTAIHYPMASLISEIAEIKNEYIVNGVDKDSLPKIIADGGVRNYSDVIKAIALGADYVMCGSIFSKMIESAAYKIMERQPSHQKKILLRFPSERYENLRFENGSWIGDYTDDFIRRMAEKGRTVEKENHVIGQIIAKIYGMASKVGQIAMNGHKKCTSEGIEKYIPVEYTISTWVENMRDYLKSAMSYTNSRTLDELKESQVIIVSNNTVNSINK